MQKIHVRMKVTIIMMERGSTLPIGNENKTNIETHAALDLPSLTTEKKSIESCKWTAPTMTKLTADVCKNCLPLKADGL